MSGRRKGELEQLVLAALWASTEPLAANDVRDSFDEPIPAVTTIITVLERLRSKGLVERTKAGTDSFRYSTTSDQSTLIADSMANALASSTNKSLALMNFTGQLSDEDRETLRLMLDARE